MKKYTRHRGVPVGILNASDADLCAKKNDVDSRVASGKIKPEKVVRVDKVIDSLAIYHAARKIKHPERYLDSWWPHESCP